VSDVGESTTSLERLFQWLILLIVKNFPLLSIWNTPRSNSHYILMRFCTQCKTTFNYSTEHLDAVTRALIDLYRHYISLNCEGSIPVKGNIPAHKEYKKKSRYEKWKKIVRCKCCLFTFPLLFQERKNKILHPKFNFSKEERVHKW